MVADWNLIRQRRQQLVDKRLLAANRKRFSYDYHIGDEVLKLIYDPTKLGTRAEGPFRIEAVHANGTVTIRLDQYTKTRPNITQKGVPTAISLRDIYYNIGLQYIQCTEYC